MKKSIFLVLATILCATNAWAWCGNSFITVNGLWCTGSNSYVHDGGKFDGKDLGTLTALELGGELQVWPGSEEAATMYYSIDNAEAVAISLPKTGNEGENSKHAGSATVDLSALAAGEHTLAVWFNHGSDYDSNNNSNFVATFTTPEAVVYEDITYTIQCAGFTGTPKIKWWGANGLADAEEAQEMTKGNYNRYSYTFTQIDTLTGVSFYIELDGFQSKTIKIHKSNNVTYFYTILQDVVVKGEFDEWGEGILLETRSDDYTTVSGVVQLDAEKTYQFKLIVNDNWKGVNEDVTVTKDAPTTTIGTGDLNAKIKSELKGGYTFTYNYLTQEVTVAYPYVGTLDLGELAPYYGFDGVQLADDNYNEITIYNLQDEAYQYGEEFEAEASIKHNGEWLTLTGKASWTLADGVMTMVATNMVDENNTVSYTITATALAPQEYTIVCNGTYEEEVTEYYSSAKYTATTEDEDVIIIEIGTFGSGEEAETSVSGQFNDNWFASVEYTIAEGEDGVHVLTATATDEVGNTYNITMTATKAVYPTINIYGATATLNEEEGALTLSGEYEGQTINCEIWGYIGAGDYEYVGILAADYSFEWGANIATVEEESGQYTLTGVFLDYMTEKKYNVMITTKANTATALDNVTSTVAPVKVIENNQLIIIKNGVRYNVMGATVK